MARNGAPTGGGQDMGYDDFAYRRTPGRASGENTTGGDAGNVDYVDRGYIGHRTSDTEKFLKPAETKVFVGYGMDEGDFDRGYVVPELRELPDFDLGNYADRYSQPKSHDIDPDNRTPMERDWAFRDRERTSKGFLVRDHQFKQRG